MGSSSLKGALSFTAKVEVFYIEIIRKIRKIIHGRDVKTRGSSGNQTPDPYVQSLISRPLKLLFGLRIIFQMRCQKIITHACTHAHIHGKINRL